jgi:hypothetical protein
VFGSLQIIAEFKQDSLCPHFFNMKQSRIFRARQFLAAVFYFLRGLSILATLGGFFWAWLHTGSPWVIHVIVGGVAITIVISLLYFFFALGVFCPTCRAKVFGLEGCSRNPRAKRLLGSYNLFFAGAVLTFKRLDCQYCSANYRFRGAATREAQNFLSEELVRVSRYRPTGKSPLPQRRSKSS